MHVMVRLAFVMALLLSMPACGLLFQSGRVDVPFQAGVKGAVAEAEFRAPLTRTYVFYLYLHHDPGNGDPRDPVRIRDRERVSRLAGSGAYDGRTMRRIDNGLPIPVRLIVTRSGVGASEIVLDQVYSEHELNG